MKGHGWQITLGLILVLLSAGFYLLHYAIFRDYHHIFIYMVGDIAFVFIEVLLVTLIIHRLLSERERRSRMEKLNMVIGAFFSEVGTKLLTYFSDLDPNLETIRKELLIAADWTDRKFMEVTRRLKNYKYDIKIEKGELVCLRDFLVQKRDFLLRLLENPNLLEHESFSELLRSVFHLSEELETRQDLGNLPDTDYEHLSKDIKRSYVILVHQWFDYMRHLKDNFPYLFSLAMRTNPFDQTASPVVK